MMHRLLQAARLLLAQNPRVRMAAPRPMKEEKLKALLLKLRKGSGWGTIHGVELEQVLNYLGGWTLAEVHVLQGDAARDYYRGRDAESAKQQHDYLKEQEVQELPGPEEVAQLPLYTKVYTDVQDVTTQAGVGGDYTGFYYREWAVRPVLTITSLDHHVFTSKDGHQGFLGDYPQNSYGVTEDGTKRNLMGWLTLDTKFLDQVNAKLGMESYEVERRNEKALRTRENTGTCPACFGNFKLTPRALKGGTSDLPGMVLHGYQRPGIGYVLGNCFGQDYPPFELSVVGTVHFCAAQQQYLDNQEAYLVKLNNNEIDVLHKGDKIHKKSEMYEAAWGRLYLKEINDLKGRIKGNEKFIDSLEKEIKNWILRPLPTAGSAGYWKP